jgi:hypothetical protein
MKTAGRATHNRYAAPRSEPRSWNRRREHILLNDRGWKTRENPVTGEVFFLTSPFIELIRVIPRCALGRCRGCYPLSLQMATQLTLHNNQTLRGGSKIGASQWETIMKGVQDVRLSYLPSTENASSTLPGMPLKRG